VSGAVNSCINHSFLHLYLQFYYVSVRSTWYDVRGPHNFRGAPVAQQPLPSLVLKSVVTATYYSSDSNYNNSHSETLRHFIT